MLLIFFSVVMSVHPILYVKTLNSVKCQSSIWHQCHQSKSLDIYCTRQLKWLIPISYIWTLVDSSNANTWPKVWWFPPKFMIQSGVCIDYFHNNHRINQGHLPYSPCIDYHCVPDAWFKGWWTLHLLQYVASQPVLNSSCRGSATVFSSLLKIN